MTTAEHHAERIAARAVAAHTDGHTTGSPHQWSRAAAAYALAATLARQVAREQGATREQGAAAAANYWQQRAANYERNAKQCQNRTNPKGSHQ